MSKRRGQRPKQAKISTYVTVAFAEDVELAKQYKRLLNASDIPVAIKSHADLPASFPGVAVLVPESHLDEAHIMIESHGSSDSFYDLAFEDDDYDSDEDECEIF